MRVRPDEGFASDAYQAAKALWKGLTPRRTKRRVSAEPAHQPFSKGRDPQSVGDILSITAQDMGWSMELEQAQVIADWEKIIGATTAPHTTVIELSNGVLIVQCDSTAWATELRRMRAQVLSRIIDEYPQAGIQDLRFLAPGAPTWRHGARVAKGRGPRDTYG